MNGTNCYLINGRHKLLHADSAQPLAKLFEKSARPFVEALITDPPYGIDYQGNTFSSSVQRTTTQITRLNREQGIANDNHEQLRLTLRRSLANTRNYLQPGSPIYLFAPIDAHLPDFLDVYRERAWHLQSVLVWDKITAAPTHYDYQPRHEFILYGWVEGAAHHFYGPTTQRTLLVYPRHTGKGQTHPTAKPLPLLKRLIENSTKPDQIILDPFAGSGSTLFAADELNRTAYCVEINQQYIDLILKEAERRHLSIEETHEESVAS